MSEKKSLHDIFQKPVKTQSNHPKLLCVVTIVGLLLIGLLFPIAGLPYAVVMIDNHTKYGKLLLAFSIIGAIIWISIMVYGWIINTSPIERNYYY